MKAERFTGLELSNKDRKKLKAMRKAIPLIATSRPTAKALLTRGLAMGAKGYCFSNQRERNFFTCGCSLRRTSAGVPCEAMLPSYRTAR